MFFGDHLILSINVGRRIPKMGSVSVAIKMKEHGRKKALPIFTGLSFTLASKSIYPKLLLLLLFLSM